MRGILFKPDMIKAIREGKKTQTRRVINLQPPPYCATEEVLKTGAWNFYKDIDPDFHAYLKRKPRYQVGEVVYIKEACNLDLWDERNIIEYKSDWLEWLEIERFIDQSFMPQPVKWRSPMFMPEWAARYFIKILDIRPERLQDITEEDAIAEGIAKSERTGGYLPGNCDYAIRAYEILWDSINPKYPWASNPWVWRYRFQRIENEDKNRPTR